MKKGNTENWFDLLSGDIPDPGIELPVLSGSMEPLMPLNSVVIVQGISEKGIQKLHRGAIIVYRVKFRLTAHRMILKVPFTDYVYEKGDRNRFGSFISKKNVIGVVSSVKYNGKVIHDFFSSIEIKNAKREVLRIIVKVIIYTALTLPRRIKSVFNRK